jgi:hypothetical protein
MGTHITKVKSVTLDKWTAAMAEHVCGSVPHIYPARPEARPPRASEPKRACWRSAALFAPDVCGRALSNSLTHGAFARRCANVGMRA